MSPTLAIYANGSGITWKVRAAAVAPATNKLISACIGEETTSTVHAAELLSILMGPDIVIQANFPNIVILTDNQAALKTPRKPGRQFRQHIVSRIVYSLEEVKL
jgi:hypothetical protein